MSAEPEDVEDITSICGGLNINIGTLTKSSIEGMFRAGRKANELNHPILLDPVGAGASALRTNTAVQVMEQLKRQLSEAIFRRLRHWLSAAAQQRAWTRMWQMQ